MQSIWCWRFWEEVLANMEAATVNLLLIHGLRGDL